MFLPGRRILQRSGFLGVHAGEVLQALEAFPDLVAVDSTAGRAGRIGPGDIYPVPEGILVSACKKNRHYNFSRTKVRLSAFPRLCLLTVQGTVARGLMMASKFKLASAAENEERQVSTLLRINLD